MRVKIVSVIVFNLICFVIACTPKAAPVITGRTDVPPPPPPAPIEQSVAKLPTAEMEAGKVIYTTKCVRCHEAKPVANWTTEQWVPILKSMTRKAKLDSLEIGQVTAYVHANALKGN